MSKGNRVREFFEIEAKAIYERYKSIEKLLPVSQKKGSVHPAEEGRFVESLLRDFLNKHLPKDLKAISGFVLRTSTKTGMSNLQRVQNEIDANSPQLDIIVYDVAHFPIYEMFEEFCIVPPEGVIAVISVKKTLRMRDIEYELMSLLKTAEICTMENMRAPFFCLFGFTSSIRRTPKVQSNLFNKIDSIYKNTPFDFMVNEVTILDSFMFFKYRREHSDIKGKSKYVLIDVHDEYHVALQRLIQSILGVYYNKSLNTKIERPGYVSFKKGTFGDAKLAGYIDINDKNTLPNRVELR